MSTIRGPRGVPGVRGPKGDTGPAGPTGAVGPTGLGVGVNVLTFAGSDLGAKLNTASAQYEGQQVILFVPPGNYDIATQVAPKPGHRIRLSQGSYTTSSLDISLAAFHLSDLNTLEGDGWNTIIYNPPSATTAVCINVDDSAPSGVLMRDLQILGGHDANLDANSTIAVGNAKQSRFENLWINGTYGFGIALGGDSSLGDHCEDCWVVGCLSTNTVGGGAAVVNARRFHFLGNTWKNPGNGTNLIYALDIEPNTSTDVIESFEICNNIIDGTGSVGEGILIQGVLATMGPGVISNNTILGGPNELFNPGISWNGAHRIQCTNNMFMGTFNPNQGAFVSAGAVDCVFSDNTIIGSGESAEETTVSILLTDTTDCKFTNNHLLSVSGSAYGRLHIKETTGCDRNYFAFNDLDQAAKNSGTDHDPHIELTGANSRAWMNNMGGRMRLGGVEHVRRKVTANTSVAADDQIVGVDSSGGAVTVTLPDPATFGRVGAYQSGSQILTVKDEGFAAATHTITVARHATEKIDNAAADKTIVSNGGSLRLYTDGTNWFSA